MATSINSETPDGKVIELSQAELEAIAGGVINVSFTLLMTEDSHEFTTEGLAGGSSAMATAGQRRRSLFGIQVSGTFQSMDHFASFFSRLSSFFGRR